MEPTRNRSICRLCPLNYVPLPLRPLPTDTPPPTTTNVHIAFGTDPVGVDVKLLVRSVT